MVLPARLIPPPDPDLDEALEIDQRIDLSDPSACDAERHHREQAPLRHVSDATSDLWRSGIEATEAKAQAAATYAPESLVSDARAAAHSQPELSGPHREAQLL
jgi:hypothetical protein